MRHGQGTDWSVLAWRVAILVVFVVAWQGLTGIPEIASVPGLHWLDPFFISRPSQIAERFVYLTSPDNVRLTIWQMALSTVESTVLGFLVGVSTGFAAGVVLGRFDRLARVLDPYIVAFNSLPRIALVPLITMIFGFGLLAKCSSSSSTPRSRACAASTGTSSTPHAFSARASVRSCARW